MAKIDLGKSWDKVAKLWFKRWESTFRRGFIWGPYGPLERDIKLLPALRGKRVLVLGCGSGPDVWWLAKNGAKVTGIDISKEQLAFTKERIKKAGLMANFIQKDFDKLSATDFSKGSFDFVVSNYALQYVKNLPKLFKIVSYFLKARGKFIFSFDHPVLYATYKSRRKVGGEWKSFKDFDYLNERTIYWYFRFEKKNVPAYSYHRTISTIFNSLVNSNFRVEKILEPKPYIHSTDNYNKVFNLAKRLPFTIIFISSRMK
jgi:SAM-dependent methyltransferase